MTMEQDPSACTKKSRKPYTLTKQRESWTNDEHERFIKALQLYNRDWKKIETYVGTKTVVQIRSHAQKYFQKVLKSGSSDAIPPPRPKRRASDPPLASQASSALPDAKFMRLASEASTKAASTKGEVDSDEGQQNSKQDFAASFRSNDAVEASAQLETSRAIVSNQGLQHVYLFLASMFSQAPVNHVNMLQQLTERDRQLVTRLLQVLNEELSTPQQQQQQGPQVQQAQPQAQQQAQQLGQGHLLQQQYAQQLSAQQMEQPQLVQQLTPAVPGADAAAALAAAVQLSINAAAEAQQSAVGQGLQPAAPSAVAAQSGAAAASGAEASDGLQTAQLGGSDRQKAAEADSLTAAVGAGEQLAAADVTPITDTGQAAAGDLQPTMEQQHQQQLLQHKKGQQPSAAQAVAAIEDPQQCSEAAVAAPQPSQQQLRTGPPPLPPPPPPPEAAVLMGPPAVPQQTDQQPAALPVAAAVVESNAGDTGREDIVTKMIVVEGSAEPSAAPAASAGEQQQQVTNGFRPVQPAAGQMQVPMHMQQQLAAQQQPQQQQQQQQDTVNLGPSGARPAARGFTPFAAYVSNGNGNGMQLPGAVNGTAVPTASQLGDGVVGGPTAGAAAGGLGHV